MAAHLQMPKGICWCIFLQGASISFKHVKEASWAYLTMSVSICALKHNMQFINITFFLIHFFNQYIIIIYCIIHVFRHSYIQKTLWHQSSIIDYTIWTTIQRMLNMKFSVKIHTIIKYTNRFSLQNTFQLYFCNVRLFISINSLGPSEAIWQWRSWSTLVQVMACCLTAPSHCLNQCWLIISKVLWHSSEDIVIRRFEDTNQ